MKGRELSGLRLGFQLRAGMRVGLFGGTFDPAHSGHAQAAHQAVRRLGLERLIWLVSPGNPLKPAAMASLDRRIQSARAQAAGAAMLVSDAEARLGTRYTIDLVRALKTRWPSVRFVWIMGADGLAEIHLWKDWQQIFALVPVAVIARPGFALKSQTSRAARRFARFRLPLSAAGRLALATAPAWTYIVTPLDPSSSTRLRALALTANGEAC